MESAQLSWRWIFWHVSPAVMTSSVALSCRKLRKKLVNGLWVEIVRSNKYFQGQEIAHKCLTWSQNRQWNCYGWNHNWAHMSTNPADFPSCDEDHVMSSGKSKYLDFDLGLCCQTAISKFKNELHFSLLSWVVLLPSICFNAFHLWAAHPFLLCNSLQANSIHEHSKFKPI